MADSENEEKAGEAAQAATSDPPLPALGAKPVPPAAAPPAPASPARSYVSAARLTLLILGVVSLTYGVWCLHHAAAFILLGVIMSGLAIVGTIRDEAA